MVQLAKIGGAMFKFLVTAIPDIISYLKIISRAGMMMSFSGAAMEAMGVTDNRKAIKEEFAEVTKRAAGNLIVQKQAYEAITTGLSKVMKIAESPLATPSKLTIDEKISPAARKVIKRNEKGQQVLGALGEVPVPGMDAKLEIKWIPMPGGLTEPDIVIG